MSRKIEIASSFRSPLPPRRTAEYLASLEALVRFDGYMLVPGIVKAVEDGPHRTITSPRGRVHKERMLISTDSCLLIEIYPAFPEKMFYRSISEKFEVEQMGEGSMITRKMTLSVRPGMRPLAAWGAHMLKVAIERNNQTLAKALQHRPEEETWY